MKLWHRRAILVAAFTFFIVLSPILVLYAMGYRFGLESHEIRLVGMIDVTAEPRNVEILLDDKIINKGTSYAIRNLFPRKYNLKLQKQGYETWEKNLFVESQKVTWVKNARVFLKNPIKEKITEKKIDSFLKVNDDLLFFLITKGEDKGLWIYDLSSKEERNLFPELENDPSNFNVVDFTSNKEKIIISINGVKETLFAIIDLKSQQEPIILEEQIDVVPKKIQFSQNGEEKILYLLDETLFEYDLKTKQVKTILKDLIDFECNGNYLVILRKDGQKIVVERQKKDNAFIPNGESEVLFEIKSNKVNKVEQNKENDIAILTNQSELYLFREDKKEVEKISDNSTYFQFGEKSRKILFSNQMEALFYEISSDEEDILKQDYQVNKPNLITRYSKEIKKIGFFPDEEWVYITFNDEIKIIELDERDKRNTYVPLKETPINETAYFDKEGEFLYFLDTSLKNIFSIKIFEK